MADNINCDYIKATFTVLCICNEMVSLFVRLTVLYFEQLIMNLYSDECEDKKYGKMDRYPKAAYLMVGGQYVITTDHLLTPKECPRSLLIGWLL